MSPETSDSNAEPKAAEKMAEWFVWLVVVGGALLGLGMLLLHEFGPAPQ